MDDYFPRMTEAKPPQFSIYGEMERLRVEIRDRGFEIIKLRAQVKKMRNCENCKNFNYDETDCESTKACTLPTLEAWEVRE